MVIFRTMESVVTLADSGKSLTQKQFLLAGSGQSVCARVKDKEGRRYDAVFTRDEVVEMYALLQESARGKAA